MTVGIANVVNDTPTSGSNRSAALSTPSWPTWIRSSSGSPRLLNRRAQ